MIALSEGVRGRLHDHVDLDEGQSEFPDPTSIKVQVVAFLPFLATKNGEISAL